ncbi:MAG: cupredoxin domain-containing protein [Thermomicrobiales bacterium]
MTRLHSPRAMLSLVTAITMAVALLVISSGGTTRAQDSSVAIEGFAFAPGSITVSVGTTVTWTNNDSAPHTVTADDGSFDSGNLGQGDTYSLTFDTPGTYSYFCAIHPNMTAVVVVTGAADPAPDPAPDPAADDGSAPTQVPATGAGTTALGDSTSLLLALGAAATVLFVVAIRQRRVA